jgi:hypothetical protein
LPYKRSPKPRSVRKGAGCRLRNRPANCFAGWPRGVARIRDGSGDDCIHSTHEFFPALTADRRVVVPWGKLIPRLDSIQVFVHCGFPAIVARRGTCVGSAARRCAAKLPLSNFTVSCPFDRIVMWRPLKQASGPLISPR